MGPGLLAAALVLALAGSLAVHAQLGFPATGVDDADIFLVYARNLAEGRGPVFNVGGERVEGFSSVAWTGLATLAWLAGAPEVLLRAVSVGLCALVLAVALALAWGLAAMPESPRGGRSWLALAAAASWLLALPGFHAWGSATLMEAPLWAAGIHGLAWGLVAAPALLVVLAGVLVWVRPEALALVPIAIAVAAWNEGAARGFAGIAAGLARQRGALLAFAFGSFALLGLRWLSFGELLPNTYYAKVSPDRLFNLLQGADYLADYLRARPAVVVLAAVALGWCARGLAAPWRAAPDPTRVSQDRAAFSVSVLALAGLLLPLANGGDHFGAFRVYQPFAPLLVLPAVAALARLPRLEPALRARLGSAGLAALLLLVSTPGVVHAWRQFSRSSGIEHEFAIAEGGRRIGGLLNDAFPEAARPSLGAVVTGGLALSYEGEVRDLMGLNWRAMGHSPGDRKGERSHAAFHAETFWTAPPDLVTPKRVAGTPRDGCDVAGAFERAVLGDIQRTPRFQAEYAAGWIQVGPDRVAGYFREDWARAHGPPELVLLEGARGDCQRPPPPLPRRVGPGG